MNEKVNNTLGRLRYELGSKTLVNWRVEAEGIVKRNLPELYILSLSATPDFTAHTYSALTTVLCPFLSNERGFYTPNARGQKQFKNN